MWLPRPLLVHSRPRCCFFLHSRFRLAPRVSACLQLISMQAKPLHSRGRTLSLPSPSSHTAPHSFAPTFTWWPCHARSSLGFFQQKHHHHSTTVLLLLDASHVCARPAVRALHFTNAFCCKAQRFATATACSMSNRSVALVALHTTTCECGE